MLEEVSFKSIDVLSGEKLKIVDPLYRFFLKNSLGFWSFKRIELTHSTYNQKEIFVVTFVANPKRFLYFNHTMIVIKMKIYDF